MKIINKNNFDEIFCSTENSYLKEEMSKVSGSYTWRYGRAMVKIFDKLRITSLIKVILDGLYGFKRSSQKAIADEKEFKREFIQKYDKNKVSIAFQSNTMDKGGLEQIVRNLVVEFSKNYNVFLFINNNDSGALGQKLIKSGYNVVLISDNLQIIEKIVNKYQIRLVNFHFSTYGIDVFKKLGVKTVYSIQSNYIWFDKSEINYRQEFYNKVDQFIAASVQVKETFLKKFNVPEQNVTIINNATDFSELIPAQTISRETLGFKKDDFLFLNVASFSSVKNQYNLVKAFNKLRSKHPQAKLIMVGNILENKFFLNILKYISTNDLFDSVKIINFIEKDKLADLYTISNCFVFPSLLEGCSNALIEAYHFCLPIIASNVGNSSDLKKISPSISLLKLRINTAVDGPEVISKLANTDDFEDMFKEMEKQITKQKVKLKPSEQVGSLADMIHSYGQIFTNLIK